MENKIVISKVKGFGGRNGRSYKRVSMMCDDHAVMVQFCTLIVGEVTCDKIAWKHAHTVMYNWQNLSKLCGFY